MALGGGSVIDAAKVLAAASGDFDRVRQFLQTGMGADALGRTPIIAVPTTSGTGSEVTSWATVWDTNKKQILAGARRALPRWAIVDPLLTIGLPRGLTVSTGLDALATRWRASGTSTPTRSRPRSRFAAREVRSPCRFLPTTWAIPNSPAAVPRQPVRRARLLKHQDRDRPFAFLSPDPSSRRSARHRVLVQPPFVMRTVAGCDSACDDALRRIFGPDLFRRGAAGTFFNRSGSRRRHRLRRDAREWPANIDDALEGERGRNFIGRRETLLAAMAA